MNWLTTTWIKAHSRIDYSNEDELLELYGESAEATVLNYLNMTYEELIEEHGEVPKPLWQAALMLVDLSYQMRSPIGTMNMYVVPYTFDMLVKPYMRLADEEEEEESEESEEEESE